MSTSHVRMSTSRVRRRTGSMNIRSREAVALLAVLSVSVAANSAFIQPLHCPSPSALPPTFNPRQSDHPRQHISPRSQIALELAGGGGGGGVSGFDGGGGRGGDGGVPSKVELGLHWDGSSESSSSPCKVFITGATGCVGRKLVAALLLSTKHELICLVRNPARLQLPLSCREQARKRLQLIVGDLKDKTSYARAASSADKAVLLACSWSGEDCFRVNVESIADTISVLKPSAQIIYFSSASALTSEGALKFSAADSATARSSSSRSYLKTKAAALRFLLSLPTLQSRLTILYPSLILGPRRHGLASAIQEAIVPSLLDLPLLSPALHYIRAADAAAVTKLLLNQPNLGRRRSDVAYEQRTLQSSHTAVLVPAAEARKAPSKGQVEARHLVLAKPAWTSAWLRGLGSVLGGSLGAFLGVAGAPSDPLLAAWSARVWAGAGVAGGAWACVSIPAAMVNVVLLAGADGGIASASTTHFPSAVSSQTFKALRGEARQGAAAL